MFAYSYDGATRSLMAFGVSDATVITLSVIFIAECAPPIFIAELS